MLYILETEQPAWPHEFKNFDRDVLNELATVGEENKKDDCPIPQISCFSMKKDANKLIYWAIKSGLVPSNQFGVNDKIINQYCVTHFLVITHVQRESLSVLLPMYYKSCATLVQHDTPDRPDFPTSPKNYIPDYYNVQSESPSYSPMSSNEEAA